MLRILRRYKPLWIRSPDQPFAVGQLSDQAWTVTNLGVRRLSVLHPHPEATPDKGVPAVREAINSSDDPHEPEESQRRDLDSSRLVRSEGAGVYRRTDPAHPLMAANHPARRTSSITPATPSTQASKSCFPFIGFAKSGAPMTPDSVSS